MDAATELLYDAALALPDDERLDLLEALIASEDLSTRKTSIQNLAGVQTALGRDRSRGGAEQPLVSGSGTGQETAGRAFAWLKSSFTLGQKPNLRTPWTGI